MWNILKAIHPIGDTNRGFSLPCVGLIYPAGPSAAPLRHLADIAV